MRPAALAILMLLPGLAGAQTLSDAATRLRDDTYLRAWTAPVGRTLEWREVESGDYGRIMPQREYKKAGTLCRDVTETLTVQGEMRRGRATGCRAPDEHWHVIAATPGDAPTDIPADLPPYQPPADISADPPRPVPAPGIILRVRPPGGRNAAAPEIYLSVPPPGN